MKNQEIEIKIAYDEDWQEVAINKVKHHFELLHPHIFVTPVLVNEVRSLIANSDSSFDIVQMYNRDFVDYYKQGIVLNLSPLIKQESINIKDIFHENIFNLASVNGHISGIPISATTKGVFYNKLWFDRAGIPYPSDNWTWEDFLEIALTLHSANAIDKNQYGVHIPFHWEYIEHIVVSNGGRYFSKDKKEMLATLEAIQFVADMVHKHYVCAPSLDYFNTTGFRGNLHGMIVEYYIDLNGLEIELGNDLGVAPMPYFRNGTRRNIPWVCGFGIHSRSKNVEWSWEFLRFMTMQSNELTTIVSEGFIVAQKKVYEEVGHNVNPRRNKILEQFQYVSNELWTVDQKEFTFRNELLDPFFRKIVFDRAPVQQVLDEIAMKFDSGT
jgi:multiple sugar transport system substrate-binding protein